MFISPFCLCLLQLAMFIVQYNASELLPQKDEFIVKKAMSYLSRCIKDLENVEVTQKEIQKFPKSLTHFFPGNYLFLRPFLEVSRSTRR